MKKLEDFLFIPFDGNFLADPVYTGDEYLKPTKQVKGLVIKNMGMMKPICLVVSEETCYRLMGTSGFSVEKNELGLFIHSYQLPGTDTRITCESFLIDPKPSGEVCRNLEVAFERVYDC